MIRRKPGDERPAGWTPELKVPPTTLWLPVASDKPLKDLGREAALNVLGPGTPGDKMEQFARVIRDGTEGSRRRGAMMGGLIFFPDYNRLPPIANIDVFGAFPREPDMKGPLEYYREQLGTPDKNTVGPVEVADLRLPAGPAIRIHRRFWPEQMTWQPAAHLWEEVVFAVRPPQIEATVLLSVGWVEFAFSEALINAADAIAPTLEIKPRDDWPT
jgi:hypothetical protein